MENDSITSVASLIDDKKYDEILYCLDHGSKGQGTLIKTWQLESPLSASPVESLSASLESIDLSDEAKVC